MTSPYSNTKSYLFYLMWPDTSQSPWSLLSLRQLTSSPIWQVGFFFYFVPVSNSLMSTRVVSQKHGSGSAENLLNIQIASNSPAEPQALAELSLLSPQLVQPRLPHPFLGIPAYLASYVSSSCSLTEELPLLTTSYSWVCYKPRLLSE